MTELRAPSAQPLQPGIWLSYLSELGAALLIEAQLVGGMTFHREAEVAGALDEPLALLPGGATIRLDQRLDGDRRLVAAWPGLLAEVHARRQMTFLTVVGAELVEVERLLASLTDAARAATTLPGNAVRMRFWSFRKNAGDVSSRHVEAPTWADVSGNYAARTRTGLADLVALADLSSRSGRLVLWHGPPGTGKTTAARALSRAWSDWCRPHYVMDPERLFAEPHYLLQVAGVDDDEDDDDGRWRLVIAEDCDEYLRADAKAHAGASLGRLLNLCDGILGHGLKVVVLLTTNEDLGRLHPAITRPGRCLSQVEFQPLSPAESRTWLGTGVPAPEGPLTLAQLFAVRDQRAGGVGREPDLGGYL